MDFGALDGVSRYLAMELLRGFPRGGRLSRTKVKSLVPQPGRAIAERLLL